MRWFLFILTLTLGLLTGNTFSQEGAEGYSYKKRVANFWAWYLTRSEFFTQEIEKGNARNLKQEISQKVSEHLPGITWVFGPGENNVGHSFTLSPEGDRDKQFLTTYCIEQAPELKGWTFYDSRQPGKIDQIAMVIEGKEFKAAELHLIPIPTEFGEMLDVVVYHPEFGGISDDMRTMLTFIWLDDAIGEKGTDHYIQYMDFAAAKPEDSIPLTQFKSYIDQRVAEGKLSNQSVLGKLYRLKPDRKAELREDIYLGVALSMTPVEDFLQNKGVAPQESNPFGKLGAHYAYLAIDLQNQPEGSDDPISFRNSIEDLLDEALQEVDAGWVAGGAAGLERVYIDLLIFDKKESVKIIGETIKKLNLKHPVTLQPFYQSFGESVKF